MPPSFLSSSPAKDRASEGLAVKEASAGLVRPTASGEDSALRALTARHRWLRSREKAMNLGKDEQRPMGQGCAETNAARQAPLRAKGTPSWMSVGRSGVACSAVFEGRQTECGGDGLSSRSPGGKAQRAGRERRDGRRHQGSKPDGHDSTRGMGQRPRARRRNAEMPGLRETGGISSQSRGSTP
ncbi:hypothetical protein Pnap_4155 (plasmid) [Polaromonas naphthalenivorans CJ2]|uniref:Uncharacterized protein n=1 Tax=Polaromonas naphthalenivorans (strain CJ2) TaxID=365044 RepID=A1VUW4_POLNA|nr:hypothetical protein Pnap_4155 [Polaromonas naphthalenivorans CJ2]